MEELITKIAELVPEVVDDTPEPTQTVVTYDASDAGSCDDLDNYMFFRNVKLMRDQLDCILKHDKSKIDDLITNGHDWASDHIAAAAENVDQVCDWLKGEMGS